MPYPGDRKDRPHFHCFACNAHGDAFDLVRQALALPGFPEALSWLSAYYHVELPLVAGPQRKRRTGLDLAAELYPDMSPAEAQGLRTWAGERRLPLATASVFGWDPVTAWKHRRTRTRSSPDRATYRSAVACGGT